MKVYFVRHGRTEHNEGGRFQPTDTHLSEKGKEQVKKIGDRLFGVIFDKVYSSDSVRAIETCKAITEVDIHRTPLLRPVKKPSEVVGLKHEDSKVIRVHNEIDKHMEDASWHYSDEENFYDFRDRVLKFLDEIADRGDEKILAVTHSLVIRLIVCLVVVGEDLSARQFDFARWRLHVTNTGVTVLSHENGVWRVETFNDIAHL